GPAAGKGAEWEAGDATRRRPCQGQHGRVWGPSGPSPARKLQGLSYSLPKGLQRESVMPSHSLADVIALLRGSRLLGQEQLRELEPLAQRYSDPQKFVRAVLKRGWLTPYQALELFSGRGEGLHFGEYVVLDRVGTGSTAHVYKARHLPTGCTV